MGAQATKPLDCCGVAIGAAPSLSLEQKKAMRPTISIQLERLVALGSAFVVSLRASCSRVAVRVAGSWLVAISILNDRWTFRAG